MVMQASLLLQLLILLAVANGSAVVAKKLLGVAFARPLDGGALFVDGRPLFGPTKIIRGIVLSLLATPLLASLMGLGWKVGALVAIGAMAGDLFSSFVKRRLGLPPSSMAIGLDQIPESLLPLIAAGMLLPVTLLDIVAVVTIFFVGELMLSRILFKLRLRDRPY
jgi:CDP-diglyceride synthetase